MTEVFEVQFYKEFKGKDIDKWFCRSGLKPIRLAENSKYWRYIIKENVNNKELSKMKISKWIILYIG